MKNYLKILIAACLILVIAVIVLVTKKPQQLVPPGAVIPVSKAPTEQVEQARDTFVSAYGFKFLIPSGWTVNDHENGEDGGPPDESTPLSRNFDVHSEKSSIVFLIDTELTKEEREMSLQAFIAKAVNALQSSEEIQIGGTPAARVHFRAGSLITKYSQEWIQGSDVIILKFPDFALFMKLYGDQAAIQSVIDSFSFIK